jgi:predicted porin
MKKTLIALAALSAIAGAAQAQSSVTLYGRLDAAVASVKTEKTGAAPVASLTQTGINSSDLNSTFWGLKGSEDLGGGLKAIFKLESRFQMDTGMGTAGMFDREANVGLEGAFGSVKLGRTPTVFDDLQGSVNAVFGSNFKTAQDVAAGTGVADYIGTFSNSIKFNSATYGGFSGALQYGFGENKNSTATATTASGVANALGIDNAAGTATNALSLSVKYAAGPLMVGYGYQSEKQSLAVAGTQDTRKFNLLGASYDFGVVKLTGDYATAKDAARKDKAYQLGVVVPMGAFAIAAGYNKEKSTGNGLTDLKGTGYNLVATYDMSKRTTLYVGLEDTKTESGTTGAITESKRTNFAAGVRHTF